MGQAEALYREALAWCAAHFGARHPDAVTAALNLADALAGQGKEEAGAVYAAAAEACSGGEGQESLAAACAGIEAAAVGGAAAAGSAGSGAGSAASAPRSPCACRITATLDRPYAALAAAPLAPGLLPDLTGRLVALAQFKNEASGLREWLRHHQWQGVEHFLLLDNGSTDNWRGAVQEFAAVVTVLPAPTRHAQVEHYRSLGLPWLAARRAEYVAILDLDEYFWGAGNATLRELSARALAGGAAQLTCPFHHFGSSGWVAQPRSVRACFTRRSAGLSAVAHGKSVVRLAQLRAPAIHAHSVAGATAPCPAGLLLFHYKTQSREYWERVKMARGSATTSAWDGVRDWDFFAREDATGNATDDFRLRDALGLGPGDC